MRKLRNALILWLMSTRVYAWALEHVIPYIRFTTYYTSLRGSKYHAGYNVLQPADIITTVDRKKLTSLLIPGEMCHAALCVGLRKLGWPYEVVEMTHTNYTKSDFFDICKESDRVVILRCKDWVGSYRDAVIEAALSFEGAHYDSAFDLGIQSLYCSELDYQADRRAAEKLREAPRLQVDLADLAGLGRPYISPDGLLFAKNVVCVWDSDGKWLGMSGPEIEKEVQRERSAR
jgi:hypothetical protein